MDELKKVVLMDAISFYVKQMDLFLSKETQNNITNKEYLPTDLCKKYTQIKDHCTEFQDKLKPMQTIDSLATWEDNDYLLILHYSINLYKNNLELGISSIKNKLGMDIVKFEDNSFDSIKNRLTKLNQLISELSNNKKLNQIISK